MNKEREELILSLMVKQSITREEAIARIDGLLGAMFGQTTGQRDSRFRDANWGNSVTPGGTS